MQGIVERAWLSVIGIILVCQVNDVGGWYIYGMIACPEWHFAMAYYTRRNLAVTIVRIIVGNKANLASTHTSQLTAMTNVSSAHLNFRCTLLLITWPCCGPTKHSRSNSINISLTEIHNFVEMALYFIEKLWTGSRSLKEVIQKGSKGITQGPLELVAQGKGRWSTKLAYEEMWDVQRRLKFSRSHQSMIWWPVRVQWMSWLNVTGLKKVRSWHTSQKLNPLWQGSLKPFLKAINSGWVAGSVPTIALWSIITAQALWEASSQSHKQATYKKMKVSSIPTGAKTCLNIKIIHKAGPEICGIAIWSKCNPVWNN